MNQTILLIPHYNNPLGLKKSIESINPSENIDILIVDDGSQKLKIDESIISNSFRANGKIYYIYLNKNEGIENALNKGLNFILEKNYKYIARLDCGDLCLKNRFEIQEKYLKENPEVKLLGSNVICVDESGHFLYNLIMPVNDKNIKNKMYLNSMFIHPSVMFCSEIINIIGKYPTNYKSAEDYAFFFKIVKKFKTSNLQDFLLKYEINPNSISLSKREEQVKSRIRIIKDNFYFGLYPVWGFIRSYILLYTPYKLILYLKKLTKNK